MIRTRLGSRPWQNSQSQTKREERPAGTIRRSRIGGLIAIGVAVIAIVALALSGRSTPTIHGNRLLVVGDSIMNQSQDSVQSALNADGWNTEVHAVGGTAVANWKIGVAELVAADHPNVVVVELGTNTCFSCSDLTGDINTVMQATSDADLVVWLNVQEDAPYPDNPRAVNYALGSALVNWPNAEMLDFSSHFGHHPEWHSGIPQGVHLNKVGQQELARLIAADLRRARHN